MTRTRTITLDPKKLCPECRKPGAGQTDNGLCLSCTTKALDPDARMRSATGLAVQRRAATLTPRRRRKGAKASTTTIVDNVAALLGPPAAEAAREAAIAVECNAYRFGLGWLNAFIATSQDSERPALYRTLSVEFFPLGVQFVGCDGTMLFRTWVPIASVDEVPMPLLEEDPDRSVVVMDVEKFALGFVRTLTTTAGQEENAHALAELSVEPAPPPVEPALGDLLETDVLVIKAFGQRLSCRLYDGQFPNWRGLNFGLDAAEQVEGMTLAVRLFASVGKLRGMLGVDCEFHGDQRSIVIHGTGVFAEVRGLLMPMRRASERKGKADADGDEQLDDGNT